MPSSIRVAILDDHPDIVEGYLSRLAGAAEIDMVGTAASGQELKLLLARQPVDVLLMDPKVPTSPENRHPYPFLNALPRLLQTFPHLAIEEERVANRRQASDAGSGLAG